MYELGRNSLQKTRLVLGFVVVSKLNLALQRCKLGSLLFGGWVCSVKDGVPRLHIEQVELNRVVAIDILV